MNQIVNNEVFQTLRSLDEDLRYMSKRTDKDFSACIRKEKELYKEYLSKTAT